MYVRIYARTDDGQTFETGFIRSTLSKSRPKRLNLTEHVVHTTRNCRQMYRRTRCGP